ncbi:DMT family transporter [Cytobacillus firmus]|uniref:DMT family transporter n=1 Tax=Cytobacillus firmus TaxID=1399 RepID=UPI0020304B77|nr:SMR family transporter [Cytobacillus firmus]URT68929.1 SMR family transporter [Cytobacillus firmus]
MIRTFYSVFSSGLGTVGTVAAGMLFWGETINLWKVFFVALMITGIIGLKVSQGEPKNMKGYGLGVDLIGLVFSSYCRLCQDWKCD